MQLKGEVVEERGLTGAETLPMLLSTFTERKANIDPVQIAIPGTNELCFEQIEKRRGEIVGYLEKLIVEVPLVSEIGDVEQALRELTLDYLCSELDLKYDRISPELFDINRVITHYVHDAGEIEVVIPLFASVKLGKEKWKITSVKDLEDSEYHIEIISRTPPITRDAKQKTKQFILDYMGVVSRGLNSPYIGDLLLRDLRTGEANLDLDMHWIPKPSELEIQVIQVDKDPFIIGKVYDRKYLVANWGVRGEEPYQHYLEEFRESKAG